MLPFVLDIGNAKFQNVLIHPLFSHGHESSATHNKIGLVIGVAIGYDHRSPLLRTKGGVLASYLHSTYIQSIPNYYFFKK